MPAAAVLGLSIEPRFPIFALDLDQSRGSSKATGRARSSLEETVRARIEILAPTILNIDQHQGWSSRKRILGSGKSVTAGACRQRRLIAKRDFQRALLRLTSERSAHADRKQGVLLKRRKLRGMAQVAGGMTVGVGLTVADVGGGPATSPGNDGRCSRFASMVEVDRGW